MRRLSRWNPIETAIGEDEPAGHMGGRGKVMRKPGNKEDVVNYVTVTLVFLVPRIEQGYKKCFPNGMEMLPGHGR